MKNKYFVVYSNAMIMGSTSDPCEMKLLMLSTKISEIILHPFETKAEGGMKMGKNKGCIFV